MYVIEHPQTIHREGVFLPDAPFIVYSSSK